MKKYFPLTVILSICLQTGMAQSDYCRLLYKKRPINYYWDWHNEYDYKVPAGVYKESVYHQELNSKDSMLESETVYNKQGQPVSEKHYAVPSGGELIFSAACTYNENNLLIQTVKHYTDCVLGSVTVTIRYEYDSLRREILNEEDGPGAKNIETVYSNNLTIKKEHYPNGKSDTLEIHFYQAGREDSVQVFQWGQWIYTSEFQYDPVKRMKEIYLRFRDRKVLRSRFRYNEYGAVHGLLIKNLPNWNDTRKTDVVSLLEYNPDRSVRQCNFFVKGKKVFIKKHVYTFFE